MTLVDQGASKVKPFSPNTYIVKKVCLLMLYRISPEVVYHFPDHVCRNNALLSLTRFHILKADQVQECGFIVMYQDSSSLSIRELQNNNTLLDILTVTPVDIAPVN